MFTLLNLTGSSVAYVSANKQYYFQGKNRGTSPLVINLFINFGNFATFANIYSKIVMCTLLTLMASSVAYVSAIHSIFLRVEIVVQVRR